MAQISASTTFPVSTELVSLLALVGEHRAADGLHLDRDRMLTLVKRLQKLARLARNIEDQLLTRLMKERQTAYVSILDEEASDFLAEGLGDNVVSLSGKRPKGGRS